MKLKIILVLVILQSCSNANEADTAIFDNHMELEEKLNSDLPVNGIWVKKSQIANANLASRKLSNVRFMDCDMRNIQFQYSQLGNLAFKDCNIQDGRWLNSNINKTKYAKANLFNGNFDESYVSYSTFAKSDLRQVSLNNSEIVGCNFSNCLLNAMKFVGVMENDTFENCDLSFTKLRGKISNCIFLNCVMNDLEIFYAQFESCTFRACKVYGGHSSMSRISNCDFTGSEGSSSGIVFRDSLELLSNRGLLNNNGLYLQMAGLRIN